MMSETSGTGSFTAGGYLAGSRGLTPCTVICEDGVSVIEEGLPDRCDFTAVFVRDMVNAHTHCADFGLQVPPGMSLEELVAPPDGLKHRYLGSLTREGLADNMRRFSASSASYGTSAFIDFREGGAEGCRLLRECSEDAVILGRPLSKEYDPGEIADILSAADGIGLSSISDMDRGYVESVADDVRAAGKIFAIHASERIREDIDFILSMDPAFVVHMCEATDSDLSKCAEAEVPIVVCPSSNAYFGKKAPVARMAACGADIGLGTDNGMLCAPDMVAEAARLSVMMESSGMDGSEAWKSVSGFATKILYRAKRLESNHRGRYLTVIPVDRGGSAVSRRTENAFRTKI